MAPSRIVHSALSLRWQLKAVIPIVGVLLLGLVVFGAILPSLGVSNRSRVLMAAAAGAVIVCGVLLTVLVVLVERPLKELEEVIGRVREGDFSARVDFARRHDDVGELGRRFNQMVQQLEANREEIERLHRMEMTRAEHLASVGELAAGLAHEIRNPLAGIAGVVEVIGKELPQETASRSVLPEVQGEIRHIQEILNDLLAYSRPRPPDFHEADLTTTIEQAVLLARQQVRTKPIEVCFEASRDLPPVVHDPAQIQQVLLNLVLNGIQAIQGAGRVQIAARREGRWAIVSVTDTGQGISEDSKAKIFKPFFTTKSEGTGLGLPLARGLVESHGGRIELTSDPGHGSKFEVWLPLQRAAARQAGRSAQVLE